MSLSSVLERGRAAAEARMTDTCRVGPRTRSPQMDPDTLKYTYTVTAVYEGICELQFGTTQPNDSDVAGQNVNTQSATLKLPVNETSALVNEDHYVEILNSQTDEGLVGLMLQVGGFNAKTYSTCRRFPVTLTT